MCMTNYIIIYYLYIYIYHYTYIYMHDIIDIIIKICIIGIHSRICIYIMYSIREVYCYYTRWISPEAPPLDFHQETGLQFLMDTGGRKGLDRGSLICKWGYSMMILVMIILVLYKWDIVLQIYDIVLVMIWWYPLWIVFNEAIAICFHG